MVDFSNTPFFRLIMADPADIKAVRAFNRFYTGVIGALDESYLGSGYSLPEVRMLFEIRHGAMPTASGIAHDLGLDAGYVSRMLTLLIRKGLVTRTPSRSDKRIAQLSLTVSGRRAQRELEARASEGIAKLFDSASGAQHAHIVGAMNTIRIALDPSFDRNEHPIVIRAHRSGDMGWVVQTHGELYRAEYGWDERFEALVARIVADFIDNLERSREQCWIAEQNGERVGSVFLVRHPKRAHTAKLRLLLVHPSARGHGLGAQLVGECIRFARESGYRRLVLWTNDVLVSARRIYEAAGFKLVETEKHESYGKQLVAQTWELRL